MKPLPYQRHIPLQFILWENARALKCFASASFDQQELWKNMEKHPGTSNNCDTWESDVPPHQPPPPPQKNNNNKTKYNIT